MYRAFSIRFEWRRRRNAQRIAVMWGLKVAPHGRSASRSSQKERRKSISVLEFRVVQGLSKLL